MKADRTDAMTIATDRPLLKAEEFLTMESSSDFELVEARLVERKKMGIEACAVTARIIIILGSFVRARRLGWILPSELTYRCFPNPDTLRRPDISFIRRERFAGDRMPRGSATIVPDLAVEVISPHDRVYDPNAKLRDYEAAGFPLVWVTYPDTREVYIHRPDAPTEKLSEDHAITGGTALPGFSCMVRDFFEDPPAI